MKFFKHEIEAWQDGTACLTHKQYRVYHVVLSRIYALEGPIVNNEHGLAGICNMHILEYRHALEQLIAMGKLQRTADSKLDNRKAEQVMSAATRYKRQKNYSVTGNPRATPEQPPSNPPPGSASNSLKNNDATSPKLNKTKRENARASARASLENDQKTEAPHQLFNGFDFLSSDEAAFFSATELSELANDHPFLKDVKAAVRLADRILQADPTCTREHRKSAILASLRSQNAKAGERAEINRVKAEREAAREAKRDAEKQAKQAMGGGTRWSDLA